MNSEHFERSLLLSLLLTLSFLLIELLGAYLSHSLSLLSDAAHMLVDSTALFISFVATRISKRPADANKTFGYYRFEILAASINAMLLFMTAIYILYQAYIRLDNQIEISSPIMFMISFAGLIINFISLKILSHDHHKTNNLNIKSAYLEVLSDLISSVAVLITAVLIYYTDLLWIDSLIALGIAAWIMPRTWNIFQQSINVLMESVPDHIKIEELIESVLKIENIISVHDLHVWSITADKVILSAHILIENKEAYDSTLQSLKVMLAKNYNIHHTTIQIEQKHCENKD